MRNFGPIPLDAPLGGLVENSAFIRQPPGSSPDLLNVRPFDPATDRARLSQRAGMSTYMADPVSGANRVQEINQVTSVTAIGSLAAGTLLYTRSFNDSPQPYPIDNGGVDAREYRVGPAIATRASLFSAAAASFRFIRNANLVQIDMANTYDAAGVPTVSAVGAGFNFGDSVQIVTGLGAGALINTQRYILRCLLSTFVGETTNDSEFFAGMAFRADIATNKCLLVGWHRDAGAATCKVGIYKFNGNAAPTVVGAEVAIANQDAAQHTLEARVNLDSVEILWDGVSKGSIDISGAAYTGAAHKDIGFSFIRFRSAGVWAADLSPSFDDIRVWAGIQSATQRSVQLVAVSNGDIKVGTRTGGLMLPSSGGTAALSASVRVIDSIEAFGKLYFMDGTLYKVYDPALNTVAPWTASAGVGLPGDADNDGDADTAGQGATFGCLYRGRMTLAGVQTDPQNIFMSKVGNPRDYDYVPGTPTAASAVAFGTSLLGRIGDVVTCLAGFQDDILFIGCQKSIWLLVGDPADGGSVDLLTPGVGVAGPQAWCMDADKNLYFFGTNGLYRLRLNQFGVSAITRLSKARLDKTFGEVNFASNRIELAFDNRAHGVLITITPVDQGPTTHYFYDIRVDAFWPDQWPDAIGPTAMHVFSGDDPDDRELILGGFDGKLRFFDSAAKNDDGTAISSRAVFGPIAPGGITGRITLNSLRAVMGGDSDRVEYAIRSHEDPESVLATAQAFGGEWSGGGQQVVDTRRASGACLSLELSNATKDQGWSLERIEIGGLAGGRTKGTTRP